MNAALTSKNLYKMWNRGPEEDRCYGAREVDDSPLSRNFCEMMNSSAKVSRLLELIATFGPTEKVVLGSSNMMVNAVFAEVLRFKFGCNTVVAINADNPRPEAEVKDTEARAWALEQFRTDKSVRFMVVDTTKGAVGLNLDSAFRLIFLVPEFSEVRDQQFASRHYRVSQRELCCYTYRLVTGREVCSAEEYMLLDVQSRQNVRDGIWADNARGLEAKHGSAGPSQEPGYV